MNGSNGNKILSPTEAAMPSKERPFSIPPKRHYRVRKGGIEYHILAHLMQHCEPATVQFIDFEIDPQIGPTPLIHRVFFNTDDVEIVPEPSTTLIH